eukprot:gene650-1259_t
MNLKSLGFGGQEEDKGNMFSSFTKQNSSIFASKENSSSSILPNFVPKSVADTAAVAGVPGFQEEPACAKCCPKLTFKQRLIGFFGCAGFGYLLSIIGTLILIGGPTAENIRAFAVLYVFGNVIALMATGFLLGPKTQCIRMWDPTRRISTAFYLIMLIIVFAVALAVSSCTPTISFSLSTNILLLSFNLTNPIITTNDSSYSDSNAQKQHVLLVLFLLFIEVLAALWYSISYIPFARKMVIEFFKRTLCKTCWDAYQDSKGGGGGGGSSSA